MPPGTTPPLVAIYSASTVPVIQIGLTSDTLSEQALFDFGNYFIRTQLATVQGAALPFPYGGEQRPSTPGPHIEYVRGKKVSPLLFANTLIAQKTTFLHASATDWKREYTP